MKPVSIAFLVFLVVVPGAQLCAEDYVLRPDSQRQAGVPKGTVTQQTWTSKIMAFFG